MKRLGYVIYGIIFNIFRLCPIKKKKVVLFMIHNSKFKGNLKFIHDEMKNLDSEFEFIVVSKKQLFSVSGSGFTKILSLIKAVLYFYFVLNYHLATAEYIFLNDNFQPLAYMNISKKAKVIQLWHGVGAFKRFGLTTETDPVICRCTRKGNQKVTYMFVSSKQVLPFHEEAMGIPRERILPIGIPVMDYYLDEKRKKEGREAVYQKYPELRGKKVLLYTPTFRATEEENKALLQYFDYREIKRQLGEEWAVLIRLHPQIRKDVQIDEPDCYDVTEYEDIKELMVTADALVNDYSSTVVEYALLRKPIYLYAYDLEKYDRGFYRDYKESAPGPVAYNLEELIKYIKLEQVDEEKLNYFLSLHYDFELLDGKATERVVAKVLEKGL